MYWHDGWAWGAGLVMFLLMIAFWVGVVAVLVGLVRNRDTRNRDGRNRNGRNPRPRDGADAQAILDRRFARGEIEQDEYERRSAALRTTRSPTG